MAGPVLTPNIRRPDELYDQLVALHDGLTPERSQLVNWRLILILANHIGNGSVLRDAIALARGAAADPSG